MRYENNPFEIRVYTGFYGPAAQAWLEELVGVGFFPTNCHLPSYWLDRSSPYEIYGKYAVGFFYYRGSCKYRPVVERDTDNAVYLKYRLNHYRRCGTTPVHTDPAFPAEKTTKQLFVDMLWKLGREMRDPLLQNERPARFLCRFDLGRFNDPTNYVTINRVKEGWLADFEPVYYSARWLQTMSKEKVLEKLEKKFGAATAERFGNEFIGEPLDPVLTAIKKNARRALSNLPGKVKTLENQAMTVIRDICQDAINRALAETSFQTLIARSPELKENYDEIMRGFGEIQKVNKLVQIDNEQFNKFVKAYENVANRKYTATPWIR